MKRGLTQVYFLFPAFFPLPNKISVKAVTFSLSKGKQTSTIVYNRGEVVSERRAKKTKGKEYCDTTW